MIATPSYPLRAGSDNAQDKTRSDFTGELRMTSDDIPAPPQPTRFLPDAIMLYGVRLDNPDARLPFIEPKILRLEIVDDEKPGPVTTVKIAVCYGYAFEGHCYRFDRPRIFVFEGGGSGGRAQGCGYGDGYWMWQIGSLDRVMELGVRTGLAEDTILDANLPGQRAPNTYGDHVRLAHRGGRLNGPNRE